MGMNIAVNNTNTQSSSSGGNFYLSNSGRDKIEDKNFFVNKINTKVDNLTTDVPLKTVWKQIDDQPLSKVISDIVYENISRPVINLISAFSAGKNNNVLNRKNSLPLT